MRVLVRRSVVTLMLAMPILCFAANECAATVDKRSQTKKGAGWALEFEVKTNCASSTGRFDYTYIDDKGKTIERRSPSWTSSDGRNFVMKHEMAEPGGIKSLAVKATSIESTKNP